MDKDCCSNNGSDHNNRTFDWFTGLAGVFTAPAGQNPVMIKDGEWVGSN